MNTTSKSSVRNPKHVKALRSTRLITFSLLAILCVVALGAGSLRPLRPTAAHAQRDHDDDRDNNGQGGGQISEHARRQIEGLMREKATRSRGRRKMDSRLIYSIKMHRHEKIADDVDTLEVTLPRDERGDAIVDITADVDNQLIDKLKDAGVRILNSLPEYRSIRAAIDLDTLDTISDFPEIKFIQPMQEALTSQDPDDPEHLRTTHAGFEEPNLSQEIRNAIEEFQQNSYSVSSAGVRKSEAELTHRAAIARNTYGFNGTGIKIGVLSDGVRNLAAVQASGDVGPVTVLPGQSGTSAGQCSATASCDEGTAMLEIVHDIAPGAQLFFATAFGGSANFANNIRNLRLAGCDIIIDDVFYFAESPFQDGQAPSVISPTNGGVIAQAVNDVTASGALYFSSAGNSGNKNDGTSGVWEGDFVDGGNATAPLAGAGRVHTFPGGNNFDVVTAIGSSQYNLNWSDPLGGSSNDYDLFALNSTGTSVIAASTGNQSGTQDPFEAIGPAPAGSRLVIAKFSGVGRYLRLTTNRGRLNVNTPGQTTGHSCGADAFGVAATSAIAQFPNAFTAANQVETFSSDGPRKLFYQANGTAFTPGDVSSTGGISRQKPDITAADGVSVTGAGGFGVSFFGTSAAAPHAGAIAALLKSSSPLLTNAQIRTALQSTAIDNEAAGVDRDSGFGIIMPDSALAFLGTPGGAANVTLGTTTVSEVGGNANSFIEPGERGTFNVPLVNPGVGAATSVSATLSSSTPGVIITPSASRAYPNIPAAGGTSSSATPFEFVYQEGAAYAANLDFVVTVNYNGVTRTYPVKAPTGVLANISTTLDTTAPVSGPGFTAITGLQTSRLNFTFPINACGAPKANPGFAGGAATRRFDAYTFTNTSASTICVTALLTHSATALLYVDAYIPTYLPATPQTNFAGDNGGSSTSGAGTTQLFSFNVNAGQTFTIVVSESNQNGGLGVAYNLRLTGLPAAPVPANQAPVNTVPGTQTVLEDQTLTFSGGNGNQISISDADAGNNPVQVSLSSTGGVMSLGGTGGLSFSGGDGSGDAAMTFSGSIADINNALNGLNYSPAADSNGSASLSITTNDQGNTGTGGAKTDADTISINVTAVNDAPSFTAGASQTVAEDAGAQSVPGWATNISAGPADEAGQALTFTAVNNNNALFAVQPAVAADGTLTYTPAANANGSATVTVTLQDNGGTANSGVDTSPAQSFTITVTAVNDPPTANAGAAQTIECSNSVTLNGSGSDIDGDTPLTFEWREGVTVLGSGATLTTTLGFGSHTITLKVSDPSNAFGEDTVVVTVVDTSAPTITPNGASISLWPPNKQYHAVNVADLIASAADACDATVNLNSVVIAAVSSDEGSASSNDIVIAANCKSVQLRADRNGNGNGRVYTITFLVRDAVGNTTTVTRQVTVPHDQGNGSNAINSGVAYTVAGGCP